MTADIIKFPRENKRLIELDLLPSIEDLRKEQDLSTDQTIDKATEIISTEMIERLITLGYPIKTKHSKDIYFVIEAVRSLMHRYYECKHSFHPFVEISFEPDGDSGDMIFKDLPFKSVKKKKKTANTNPRSV